MKKQSNITKDYTQKAVRFYKQIQNLINVLREENGLDKIKDLPKKELDELFLIFSKYPLKEIEKLNETELLPRNFESHIKFQDFKGFDGKGNQIDGTGCVFYTYYKEKIYSPESKKFEHYYIIPGMHLSVSSDKNALYIRLLKENREIFKKKVLKILKEKEMKLKSTEEGLILEKI